MFNTVGNILDRIKSGVYDAEEEQANLSAADDLITAEMLKAEDAIRPSRTATSHSWSPELVSLQKKSNLLKQVGRYIKQAGRCIKVRGSLSERKKHSFTQEARTIDPTWAPDLSSAEVILEASNTATREARLGRKHQTELRRQHLDRLLQEMTSLGDEEDREQALKTIKGFKAQRRTHQNIHAAFKQRAPPITHVV
eukprot:CAMPEP_0196824886 /NCGR_PEP_ID=MMETSP1362-20130617/92741_1 /TAXON_ID=163516 /ORGANISM="Leptocylindrus danicus, Strain CCMP1856" /LENGTH=195 /DNA_ID=CAMNT_0042205241 /DNA_START=813 /DNA_END=1396 /DNA_ORIENTATION=+